MGRIRVLIVDDSAVVRRILGDMLAADADIEVIGSAPNGRIALAKIAELEPDIVILDVDMPDMGGLEALAHLRRDRPYLPVIMFSTLTERGAAATLDALSMGAKDYVTKPVSAEGSSAAMTRIRQELIPKIKVLGTRRPGVAAPGGAAAPRRDPADAAQGRADPGQRRGIEVLAIGASTGGPNALALILSELPASFPAPILIVQHMPPIFTRLLAGRLDAHSAIRVKEAATGDVLEPGRAWLAPGDHHMVVDRDCGRVRVRIHREAQENSCRPSVDVLFRSVARVYRAGALGVILTGMGQDGRRGSYDVRSEGGRILVQDEASSVVWGMPGTVHRAGLADGVHPLAGMSAEILRRAGVRSGVEAPLGCRRRG